MFDRVLNTPMKPIQYNVFWKIHKSIFIQAAYNPKIQRKSEVTFRIAMIPKYLAPNRTESHLWLLSHQHSLLTREYMLKDQQ